MKSLDDFIIYLESEKNYSDKTVLAYKTDIEQFYEYLCLDETEDKEESLNVNNTRSWLMELMKNSYSATSVKRKLSSLRVFSRYLFKEGIIQSDSISVLNGPKLEKKLPVFVRTNVMNELLDADHFSDDFEGLRDRLIIELLYSTGMRLSEMIGLDVKDVDRASLQIKVLGKGNKERIIPFGEPLLKDIEVYLESKKFSVNSESEAFFVKLDGDRITRGLVYNMVHMKLGEVSTLTKRSPHVLRHSFATNMLNNGADLQVIKEILGHTSLAATEVYTHTTFKELKKIYKQAHPRA